jgi:UDP-N-acetylmuramyl-tripeptide synthetase
MKIGGVEVTHLTHDSRKAKPGSCFFALKGEKSNGSMYIMQAIAKGAVLIVAENSPSFEGVDTRSVDGVVIPVLYVDNVRESMALAAKRFNNDICDKMDIIGITGTNGKTTCTYILRHLLETKKNPVGLIGTLTQSLTTPDPIELHEIFAEMYAKGIRTVVMEVSAHAIHYHKVAGIHFRTGVFTNLSQDHLDFFPTYEDYAMTKVNWMTGNQIQAAITNIDDQYGQVIARSAATDKARSAYSIDDISNLEMTPGSSTFNLGKHKLRVSLPGRFNVYNALACIKAAQVIGTPMCKIRKRIAKIDAIPGRFNMVKAKNGASVIIDYAHTPDSLEKVLTTARELIGVATSRLILVFGCGGNRDQGKRAIMGKVAANLADFVIVTSDNPRNEPPLSIMYQIESGIKTSEPIDYILIEDRKMAIHHALDMCMAGDVVVIAGKGAETTQEIAGAFHPYTDASVVEEYKG